MITELSVNIGANIEKILRDSDKSNVREFLGMVTQMAKLNQNKYIVDFLQNNLKKIGIITFKTLSKDDMHMFYDFVVLIFENFQHNRAIRKDCMQFLILGLSSKDIETRTRFIDLLNEEDRLSTKMSERVKFILKELYNPEHEKHWLTTSSNILLSLSKISNTSE
jgi:CRISPR/Cas system endoribonuclease Cas6 (RAMP superfamily)